MNRSSRSLSYGLVCAASAAALAGIAVACNDDDNNNVVPPPGEAGVGGTGGAAGSGGGAGTDAAAGSGGTEGGAGTAGTGGAEAGAGAVTMTNLTGDQAGSAANVDPNLVNAWGLAINPKAQGGPAIWVVANGTGMATVYDQTGKVRPVTVKIPVPGDPTATSGPTGQVFNDSASFMGDLFIFSTEEGAIAGWKTGATATIRVDNSAAEAIYKGLAIVDLSGGKTLLAPDFHNGKVDVFNQGYAASTATGLFEDADIPQGFAPFNVAFLDGKVYVSYAQQDADKEDDVQGAGLGYVNVFEADGTFTKRLVSQGALNAPWGMAIAPASFGPMAGALLVGNFGDGKINAFDKTTGAPMGALVDSTGKPVEIDGLWAIVAGPTTAGTANVTANATGDLGQTLFFTAGPADETHGLFGELTPSK
jgi:uncharacterized protein (TIGR03118 family)